MTPHDYQESSIAHLLGCLKQRVGAVDGSDCGVGKTLVGIEVSKRLNLPTLVVCPKPVIPGWERTAAAQDTEVSVLNYEQVRTGKTPFGSWIKIRPKQFQFRWASEIRCLIFDEGHRCMTYTSKNSELMRAARRQHINTLSLSATMADSPIELDALGYLLDLHRGSDAGPTLRNPNPYDFFQWARDHGCGPGSHNALEFLGSDSERLSIMREIHENIFPDRGVRVRADDLPGFPEIQILPELYDIEGDIDSLYAQMQAALDELKTRTDGYRDTPMTALLAARQKVELLKVPTMVELAEDVKAQGRSVALFCNFRTTLEELCVRLKTDCFIDGTQTGHAGAEQREANRLRFVNDASRFIVCISEAGGLGLDLPDLAGHFPRTSLICPGYNAKVLRQAFYRARRAVSRSKSVVRIVLAADTVEENVYRKFQLKSDCLDALNDGDLMP